MNMRRESVNTKRINRKQLCEEDEDSNGQKVSGEVVENGVKDEEKEDDLNGDAYEASKDEEDEEDDEEEDEVFRFLF